MMILRLIGYEMRHSMRFYMIWTALAAVFAGLARLGVFSLTDMPLFYLMLFGSLGIMLRRYGSTMHGREAARLFTTELSPGGHIAVRYCSALILSILTAGMIGVILRIQGEDMGALLRKLSIPAGALLIAEVTVSVFTLFVAISAAMTIANIRPFSARPTVWTILLGAALVGVNSVLPLLTESLIPMKLFVTANGAVTVSTVDMVAAGISFSLNVLLWNLLFIGIAVVCMPLILRKKLLVFC